MSRRLLAIPPAIGLVAALTVAAPADASVARYVPQPGDFYANYAEPAVAPETDESSPDARARSKAGKPDKAETGGNPVAARVLAERQAEALRTGLNPADFLFKKAKVAKQGKLLTLLVEFDENARDDFSGFSRPKSTADSEDCVTEPPGTFYSGPLHNQIPDPAASGKDNFSFWVPDFSPKHYNDLLYSDKGITTRVRPDLTDPRDGKKGIDVSGSLKGMYEEMSKGAYSVTGQAIGWLKVPHSEAWYGATACGSDMSDNGGHPANPNGGAQLPVDAVNVLAAQQPDFPWADYDVEDVSDADRDGNFAEPDGVIDHLVIVHAGIDKLMGGGAQGPLALWAYSSAVAGGHTIPGTDKKISNFIMQGEDAGVGIFAHEFGHDLGLPDLYDSQGPSSDSSVGFWDLMSSGSHSGVLFQTGPTHMGLWGKWIMGWADPEAVGPGDRKRLLTLGQSSRTPKLTEDGVIVNLPDRRFPLATPHSGSKAWWSDNTQNWADVRLSRTLQVPAGDPKFRLWNHYDIEADWDYGFIEVSTDGGATWAEQKIYDEAGTLVSTDDGYADPNGRLGIDFKGKKYGLTGSTGGWRHDYVDLAPFAGRTIQLRLRYATDPNTNEKGWLSDDFSLTAGGRTVWSDDAEQGANGWTATVDSWENSKGPGWTLGDGVARTKQFYLAEWRNTDGFDKGLAWGYDHTSSAGGVQQVERVRYNAPGLLVTLADAHYERNDVDGFRYDAPSIGSKGQLLVVDSHFDPLKRTGAGAQADPTWHKNLPARSQSSNAAFTFAKTYPMRECFAEGACSDFPAQRGVPVFTDAKTWYPGLEILNGAPVIRNGAASAVVPSLGDQPYSTRVVNADGSPATAFYGQDFYGHKLGSGNPGDEGKAMGVQIRLVSPLPGNLAALVEVIPPKK
ncbi:immune inhibitor A domain-containing protein [Nonomuraea sp. NPDC050328]|uniref:immune inhibitor A domain-containing protein n=1 Tax=Nonomuraea sp. NPDC050328 TaxID=3364361 RepID=UPI0037990F19